MKDVSNISPQISLSLNQLEHYYKELVNYEESKPSIKSVLENGLPGIKFHLSGAVLLESIPTQHILNKKEFHMGNIYRGSSFYPGVLASTDEALLDMIFDNLFELLKAFEYESDRVLKVIELDYITNYLTIILYMVRLLESIGYKHDNQHLLQYLEDFFSQMFGVIECKSEGYKSRSLENLINTYTHINLHLNAGIKKYGRFFFFRRFRENSSLCLLYKFFTSLLDDLSNDIDLVVGLEYGAVSYPSILNSLLKTRHRNPIDIITLRPKECLPINVEAKNVLILDDSLCTGASLSSLLSKLTTRGKIHFSCVSFNRIYKYPSMEVNPNINLNFLKSSFIPYRSWVYYAEDFWKHNVTQRDREIIIEDLLSNYDSFDTSKAKGRV